MPLIHCLHVSSIFESRTIRASWVEIVTVDNGSSDSTRQFADQHADTSLGLAQGSISAVRNYGASRADGDILLFLDSDCLLEPGWFAEAASILADDAIVACGSKTHNLPKKATWAAKAWKLHLDTTEQDGAVDWISTRALAIKRNAFEAVGGFNEKLTTCEDVAICHALSDQGSIISRKSLAPGSSERC